MKKLFTILFFMTAFIASAQWTTDTDVNTLVADTEALDMKALGTTDGQTYVVFWKVVPAPVNIELRLQILDADGNQTLGAEGMLVSDQIPMSTYTVLWDVKVDAENNLYIGVTGTGGGDPAFVFKIDSAGNHLWGANGVAVGSGNKVTILPLASGGAIVSWLGNSGAVMQKYDATGAAVWPSEQPLSTGSGLAAPGNFFEISGGEYIAVFHQLLSGINSYLYAQRYDVDGNAVWPNAVQIADRATAYNRDYTGIQDGDVVYMGYFSAANNRFDSYLQRINADGALPWGINGADFDTNQTNYEMGTEIAFQSGSAYVWAVCNYTDPAQSQNGAYVQKFDKNSGARQFTENAKVVYPLGSDKVRVASLQLKNDTPLFLIKDGFDNGATPVTLHITQLDENGDFAWPEETRPVATFEASKARIQFTKPANEQSVAVFIENKGDGDKIYAQNIVDETASVGDFSKLALFYANPVKDNLLLKSNSPIQSIVIFNVLGQQLFSQKYNSENEISINTQKWTSGIYFMNVSTNYGIEKGIKLIKQ